jgi:hypothetical protein
MNLTSAEQTFSHTVRVKKSDSAYLYFTLEASEGLCFYSTLDGESDQSNVVNYRDILIRGHKSLESECLQVLQSLTKQIELIFL